MNLEQKIEAILFFKSEPISRKKLEEILSSSAKASDGQGKFGQLEINDGIEKLKNNLENRGIVLLENNGEITLGTAPELSKLIEDLQKEELKQTRYEFKINRLTNILFKQTDYLNSQLDKINFVWYLSLGQGTENIGISEFAEKIADFKSKDYDWKKFLKNQERTIDEAITKVYSAFFSFEEISNETDVETTEINKLKKFMRSNINPAIYTLISFKLEIIEKPDSSHTDIKDWQTKLLKLKLERLEYIFNYGK